ncbi:hypothetical protein Hesp01_28580 [Herbidospora sp. NBRC 101105]|nr:hypothetical protein Hesp01_28580 [Herbidospora sp. NBRC 101105]
MRLVIEIHGRATALLMSDHAGMTSLEEAGRLAELVADLDRLLSAALIHGWGGGPRGNRAVK